MLSHTSFGGCESGSVPEGSEGHMLHVNGNTPRRLITFIILVCECKAGKGLERSKGPRARNQ